MINDIVHRLDLEAVFWTHQNLHSSYSHNYVEMKMSPNKVLAHNEKRWTTLLNCAVGVSKIKEKKQLNKYQVPPTPSHSGITR